MDSIKINNCKIETTQTLWYSHSATKFFKSIQMWSHANRMSVDPIVSLLKSSEQYSCDSCAVSPKIFHQFKTFKEPLTFHSGDHFVSCNSFAFPHNAIAFSPFLFHFERIQNCCEGMQVITQRNTIRAKQTHTHKHTPFFHLYENKFHIGYWQYQWQNSNVKLL